MSRWLLASPNPANAIATLQKAGIDTEYVINTFSTERLVECVTVGAPSKRSDDTRTKDYPVVSGLAGSPPENSSESSSPEMICADTSLRRRLLERA